MYFSDDIKELVELFNKHGVEYAVCGGFAVAHYGFVRMTMDFDLLVLPSVENAKKLWMPYASLVLVMPDFLQKHFKIRGPSSRWANNPIRLIC